MKLKHKRTAKYFNAGGTISKVLTGLGGGAEVLGSAINTANDPYSQTALVESDIVAQNNAVTQISEASSFDDLMNLDLNLLSHTRYLDFLPNKLSQYGTILGSSMAGAGTGAGVGGGWGALAGGVIGLGTGIFGKLRAKRNAKRLSRAYNKLIDDINDKLEWMMGNTISDIKSGNLLNATYAAYGGPLAMRYKGNMSPFGNRFSDGGIFIKPSKRGTFTAAAKKHGKSVQAFASQVLANKDNYSPAMVKKANFARNFGGRKRAEGGPLVTLGGIWDSGLTYVNNGDTHELNPMDGVLMGMDAQGVPNLVEEGETIWNDYVFSNRIKVPKAVRKKYKLKGNKDLTFANASKYLAGESEERPNDPISQRGLEAGLARLVLELEAIRLKKLDPLGILYATGGFIQDDVPPLLLRPSDNNTTTAPKPKLVNYYDVSEIPVENPGDADIDGLENYGSTLPSLFTSEPTTYIGGTNVKSIIPPKSPKKSKSSNTDLSWMRYIPAAGGAFGALQGLFSKPNYSRAKSVAAAANQAGRYRPVSYTPLGNYLTYSPFDIDYASNKSAALASANRRAAVENSGGNRAFATAATIASDYNTLLLLGELYRQAEAYNLNLRKTIADYNRGTDTTNAELGLKAAMTNQEAMMKANQSRLSGITLAAGMMDAVDQARGAGISANLSNLFNSLGDIGKEEFARNMVISTPGLYYSIGRDGKVTYKDDYYNLSEYEKEKVNEDIRRKGGKVNG